MNKRPKGKKKIFKDLYSLPMIDKRYTTLLRKIYLENKRTHLPEFNVYMQHHICPSYFITNKHPVCRP